MKVEEELFDVLQNIEFAVVQTDHELTELSDHDVLRVYEAIKDRYVAEKIGRSPRQFSLSQPEQLLYDNIRAMCEWRLGRQHAPAGQPVPPDETIEPKRVDEILLCLKRLIKSVQKWNKDGGARAYLDFISRFTG